MGAGTAAHAAKAAAEGVGGLQNRSHQSGGSAATVLRCFRCCGLDPRCCCSCLLCGEAVRSASWAGVAGGEAWGGDLLAEAFIPGAVREVAACGQAEGGGLVYQFKGYFISKIEFKHQLAVFKATLLP